MRKVGTLAETPFVQLMLWAHQSGFSGTLVLAHADVKRSFIFEGGKPVSARSNIAEEALGAMLIAEGKLTATQFQRSMEMIENKESVRTGEALVSMGLIDPAYLSEVLRRQFVRRFSEVFYWPEGKYGFVSEFPPDLARIDVGEGLPELCFRALVEKFRKTREWEKVLPEMKPVLVGGTPFDVSLIKLVGREMSFFRSINGVQDVKTILSKVRLEDDLARSMLLALRELGVIHLGDEKPMHSHVGSPGARPARPAGMVRATVSTQIMEDIYFRLDKADSQDFFEILGVERSADAAEVKKAYFELAKVYHPDRLPASVTPEERKAAEAYFARVSEARTTISNPTACKEYESKLEMKVTDVETESVTRIVESELEFQKGQILIKKGDFGGAVRLFEHAVALYDQEPEYLVYLGWANFRDGKKKQNPAACRKGKEMIAKALKEKEKLAEGHYFLGMIEKADGDPARARQYFEKTLEIAPKHHDAGSELRVMILRAEKKPPPVGLRGLFQKKS